MLPSFLAGPAIGAAAVIVALSGGYAWLKLIHEPDIRDAYAAEISALTAAQRERDQSAALRTVQAAGAAQEARAAERTIIRERIIRVPSTTACAASPSVVAALDGLRRQPGGSGAPGGASGPSDVPTAADAP